MNAHSQENFLSSTRCKRGKHMRLHKDTTFADHAPTEVDHPERCSWTIGSKARDFHCSGSRNDTGREPGGRRERERNAKITNQHRQAGPSHLSAALPRRAVTLRRGHANECWPPLIPLMTSLDTPPGLPLSFGRLHYCGPLRPFHPLTSISPT